MDKTPQTENLTLILEKFRELKVLVSLRIFFFNNRNRRCLTRFS